MAYNDNTRDTAAGNDITVDSATTAAPDTFAEQLAALYAKYGRQPPTKQEVQAHRGNPGGLPAIENLLIADWDSRQPKAPVQPPSGGADGRGGGGGGAGFGTLLAPYTGTFTEPSTANAVAQLPGLPNFGDFNYADFAPPGEFTGVDPQSIVNNPAYKFRYDEGLRALTNSRAAEGRLRSGGTLTDFMKYGQNMASTEFENEWNRGFQTHKNLYDERFGAWNAGLQKALATTTLNRDPLMEQWRTQAQTAQRQSELDDQRAWRSHLFDWETFKRNQEWPYTVLSDQQRVGLGAM